MNEGAAGVDLLGSELMGEPQVFLFTLSYFIIVSLLVLTFLAVLPPPPKSSKYREGTDFFYQDGVCVG